MGNAALKNFNHFNPTTSGFFGAASPDYALEQIVFADGAAKTSADIRSAILTAQQTDGNDYIKGSSDNDLLHGKKGNDTLEGGDDGDIYLFNKGDGKDTIRDTVQDVFLKEDDILVFGDGITLENLAFTRTGDTLRIDIGGTVGGTADSITIEGQFWASALGLGMFNAMATAVSAIQNNPLIQLGSATSFPAGFDSTGYTNDSGITVKQNPATGKLEVTVDGIGLTYVAPQDGAVEPYAIPGPNRRVEGFSFRDGTTVSADKVQQIMLERAHIGYGNC